MSEFSALQECRLSATQIEQLDTIGTEALEVVTARYGSGYPDYLHGKQRGLSYHNWHHSMAVLLDTEVMAETLGLSLSERAIGRVAAAAHDIVQLKPRGVMEQESADWLEGRLRGLVPEELVQVGALAILGTEPMFADGKLTGQVVSELAYPSRSAELVAKSVACADLGEVHAPQGPLLGHELYKEIQGVTPADTPDMEKLIGFQRGQVWLAENCRYPHPIGELVFGGLRAAIVDHNTNILDRLEAGQIENWQQLIAADEAFMRRHAWPRVYDDTTPKPDRHRIPLYI